MWLVCGVVGLFMPKNAKSHAREKPLLAGYLIVKRHVK